MSILTQSQRDVIYKLHPFLSNQEVADIVGTDVETVELFVRKNGMIKPKKTSIRTGPKQVTRYKPTDRKYSDLVKEFKEEQIKLHGRNHPFFKLQTKTQSNGNN